MPLSQIRTPSASVVYNVAALVGLLQSTGTQKALFRQPSFQDGVSQLLSQPPDFADAYRILNSAGIFPNV